MPLFGPPDIHQLKQKRNVKALINALNYRKDKEVRAKAAEALGQLKSSDAIPKLIQALKDPEARVTIAAEKALSAMVKTAVPGLIQALEDPDLRFNAIRLLGKARSFQAVDPLITQLQDDNPNVRAEAARALNLIGDSRAREALLPLLGDENAYVRNKAAEALKAMDWLPPTKADQAQLLYALEKWDELPKLGQAAAPSLIAALKSSNHYHVRDAARALGKIGSPAAVDPLIGCLDHDRFEVQEAAAEALGKIGNPRAARPLIDHFDSLTEVAKSAAIKSLGQLGGQHAIDLLVHLLDQPGDNFRRSRAARALGETGDPQAAAALKKALTDGDWMVRKSALESFEKIGGKLSLEELTVLANHHDRVLAENAIQSLGALGDPQALPTLIELLDNPQRVEQARDALVKIGQPAVPSLIDTVKRKAIFTQAAAAHALGEIGNQDAVPALVEALRTGTWSIRITTAQALSKLRWQPETPGDKVLSAIGRRQWSLLRNLGEHAVDPLIDALGEAELRTDVLQALGETGHPKVLDALLPYLQSKSWQVRKTAARALMALHKSTKLSDVQKQAILQQKTAITANHQDRMIHQDYARCAEPHTDEKSHRDTGIGLDFPL